MPTLLPWTSVEIGDLEVFVPSPPCLVVYTAYSDDGPESSVTYFWQDENGGILNHQLLYVGPVSFEAALAWAQEHAPTRNIERIHVKHARGKSVCGKGEAKGLAKQESCCENQIGEQETPEQEARGQTSRSETSEVASAGPAPSLGNNHDGAAGKTNDLPGDAARH